MHGLQNECLRPNYNLLFLSFFFFCNELLSPPVHSALHKLRKTQDIGSKKKISHEVINQLLPCFLLIIGCNYTVNAFYWFSGILHNKNHTHV